jgi:hypothetical protein
MTPFEYQVLIKTMSDQIRKGWSEEEIQKKIRVLEEDKVRALNKIKKNLRYRNIAITAVVLYVPVTVAVAYFGNLLETGILVGCTLSFVASIIIHGHLAKREQQRVSLIDQIISEAKQEQ